MVQIARAFLGTLAPGTEQEPEVRAVDHAVSIDVADARKLRLELHDERPADVLIEGVVQFSSRPVEVAEETTLVTRAIRFSGPPGIPVEGGAARPGEDPRKPKKGGEISST